MPTTEKTSALAQLAARERAVEQAKAKVAELEAEKQKAQRAVERALAPLTDYHRAIGAGEREPDAEEEARLEEAVERAQAESRQRVVSNWRAESGDGLTVETVTPRIDGQLAGAREAVERREGELRAFLARRFDDLAAKLAEQAREARGRFEQAWEAVREAEAEWQEVAQRCRPLFQATRRTGSPLLPEGDMPLSPLRGLVYDLDAGWPLPMPRSLVPDEEKVEPS